MKARFILQQLSVILECAALNRKEAIKKSLLMRPQW